MPVWEIIIFLFCVVTYSIFYLFARTRRRLLMTLNLLYGLWIMQWFGTKVALLLMPHERKRIYTAIVTYTLGIVVHHGVVMWGKRDKKIDFIHGPVSHLAMLAPAGWLMWAVGKIIIIEASGTGQVLLGVFYWSILIVFLMTLFWMAFDKKVYVKLAKRFRRFQRLAERATM